MIRKVGYDSSLELFVMTYVRNPVRIDGWEVGSSRISCRLLPKVYSKVYGRLLVWKAIPVSLPLNKGITLIMALAAPVDEGAINVGMMVLQDLCKHTRWQMQQANVRSLPQILSFLMLSFTHISSERSINRKILLAAVLDHQCSLDLGRHSSRNMRTPMSYKQRWRGKRRR